MKNKSSGKKKYILILLAAVILVFIICLPHKAKDAAVQSDTELSETEKIRNILTKVDGIDEAYVMVNTESEKDSGSLLTFDNHENEEKERISGIVVVCTGGDRGEVRKKVCGMLSALLGLPYNRIEVVGTEH